jgi:hypothetical protein
MMLCNNFRHDSVTISQLSFARLIVRLFLQDMFPKKEVSAQIIHEITIHTGQLLKINLKKKVRILR